MVSASLKDAERIERKTHVPDRHRTRQRTEVADWIETHASDEWREWTHQEIADELNYSRQHIDNVVQHYFQPAGESSEVDALADELGVPDVGSLQQALGTNVSRELLIYRLGYRDGMRDARDQFESGAEH
jgi:hypothetical protein